MELRKMIVVPVEAEDETEAEALAEYEIESGLDDGHYVECFVYNVEEVEQ
jgi:hypothetical protein